MRSHRHLFDKHSAMVDLARRGHRARTTKRRVSLPDRITPHKQEGDVHVPLHAAKLSGRFPGALMI